MPPLSDALVIAYLRANRRNRIWTDATAAEAHLAARVLRPVSYAPPHRLGPAVTLSRRDSPLGWPLYAITPTQTPPRGTVIYAHGGGWVNEIVVQHWRLCAQIAAAAAATVLVPIYPLIPFGDAATVVDGIADIAAREGSSGPLVLAGDSAGGQIVLSSAMVLRDRHGVQPARTILIAPGLDATLANPDIPGVEATDPWLGRPGIRVFTRHWRGSLALTDPRVSPLFGELEGLGPMTMFSGTRDLLNPDARLLVQRATRAGVALEYHEQPGAVHVYPLLPTASGATARRLIGERIGAALA